MMKAVIFDVMGVVLEEGNDTKNLLYPYLKARCPQLEWDTVAQAYVDAAVGRITPDELWVRCGFPEDIDALEEDYLDTQLTLDGDFLDTAAVLKGSGIRLALLSNDVGRWSAFMRRKFGVDELVETSVISGDVGLCKPDPAIYELTLERLGLAPGECAFVDDRPVNLEAAACLGILPVLYNRDGHDWQGLQITRLSQLPALL